MKRDLGILLGGLAIVSVLVWIAGFYTGQMYVDHRVVLNELAVESALAEVESTHEMLRDVAHDWRCCVELDFWRERGVIPENTEGEK